MSKIKKLGPWDPHELTDDDRRILWCFKAVGYFGNGASSGEKAMVKGIDALYDAAQILYSCDYAQRAMICENFRQAMMHEDSVETKENGRYTRLEFLRWEGKLQTKSAKEERASK